MNLKPRHSGVRKGHGTRVFRPSQQTTRAPGKKKTTKKPTANRLRVQNPRNPVRLDEQLIATVLEYAQLPSTPKTKTGMTNRIASRITLPQQPVPYTVVRRAVQILAEQGKIKVQQPKRKETP